MGTLSLCPGVDPELSSIHLPTLAYGAWTSAHRPAGGGRASSAASSSSFHSGVCVACEVFTLAVIYNTHILKNASPSHFKCSHFGSESLLGHAPVRDGVGAVGTGHQEGTAEQRLVGLVPDDSGVPMGLPWGAARGTALGPSTSVCLPPVTGPPSVIVPWPRLEVDIILDQSPGAHMGPQDEAEPRLGWPWLGS